MSDSALSVIYSQWPKAASPGTPSVAQPGSPNQDRADSKQWFDGILAIGRENVQRSSARTASNEGEEGRCLSRACLGLGGGGEDGFHLMPIL